MKLTMKKWKIAIFSVILMLIATLSLFAWGTYTPGVIGSAATASDYGLTMENGASIRIVGTSGIRFSASISEEKAASATEYGMILSTAEALNGAELTTENAKRTIKSTAGMNTVTENGNIRFNAVLTNVKDENLTRTYVARAYVTDANGTYYTDAVARSPFGVAVAAYADYKDKTGYDAIKDYIVLDVKIDNAGTVTIAREYATIAGDSISASGTVSVSDPNLNAIIGSGTEFFGLVINGKRVEMGGSSVVEIGGKDFEFNDVSVSEGTFTGTSTAHTHNYAWNTSAADADVKSCACGDVAEIFQKDYTSTRLELNYGTGATTVALPVAVTSPLLDGVDESLTVSGTSVDFSSLKENLQKHGDHTLTGTVATEDGQAHNVKFAVRLITADITSLTELYTATFAKDGEELYGCYRVTADITYKDYDINQTLSYDMANATEGSASAGFHGMLYGEKADGTRPIIKTQQRFVGLFDRLTNATVSDLIIADDWSAGRQRKSVLAAVVENCTIRNVEFRLTNKAGGYIYESTYAYTGWIVHRYCANNTFENVAITNTCSSVTTFAPLFSIGSNGTGTGMVNNTFINCTVSGAEITYIGGSPDGNTMYTFDNTTGITATDHIHSYVLVSDASGHAYRCACGATTGRENHKGGVANCGHGKICTVCGVEYSSPSGNHVGPYEWKVGENQDEYICAECGYVVDTFTTNYSTRYDVQYSGGRLNLSGYFTGIAVSNIAFNGVALNDDISAISFANVTDLSKHGDHDLTMTVTVDGQDHTVKFPVRLITADITSLTELYTATFAKDGEALYGCYRVTADITYKDYDINQTLSYDMANATEGSASAGFHGMLYGEKADGTRPIIKTQQRFVGLFDRLTNATVSDLIIVDDWSVGRQRKSVLAAVVENCTIRNVEFRLTNKAGNYIYESTYAWTGWIIHHYCANNVFENVDIVNTCSSVTTFAPLFSYGNNGTGSGIVGNTFINCTVSGAALTYVGGSPSGTLYTIDDVDGISSTGITEATHAHTYTYTGTAEGHVGTCATCGATTATLAHFGGTATCQSAGTCKLCGYEYIPASVGSHSFDGTSYVSDDEYHYLVCKYCGTVDSNTAEAHRGGTATCAQGAICDVCGAEYGAASSTGHEAFAWRSGKSVDEKYCTTCNAVVETFITAYTATRYDIDQYAGDTLDLSKYFASASNIAFNGVALNDDISAISFANVTDLQKHGDHELTMTVTEDGQDHTVTFAVRLITRSFTNTDADITAMAAAVRGVRNASQTSIYGFYRITEDLNCITTTANNAFAELWSGNLPENNTYGFAGTVYGEKADGSAPVIKYKPKSGGMFAYLVGATIRNVVFEDTYYRGTAATGSLLATIAMNTTIEDVTFKVSGINDSIYTSDQVSTGWGYGWIVNNEFSNLTFKNVNFVNGTANTLNLGRLLTDQNDRVVTFDNCTITGFNLTNVYGTTAYSAETFTGLTSPRNVIVVGSTDGESEPSAYLTEVAFDLQSLMNKATGATWAVQKGNAYSTTNSFVNKIVLGNVAAFADAATLTTAAKSKGGSSYAMKADGTTLYLCGANDYGIEYAVYEFLEQYFGFEMFSPTHYVMQAETWTNESELDASKIAASYANGVQMAFLANSARLVLTGDNVAQMRYSGEVGTEMLMYVKEGDYSSKVHNAFSWLDPATYKGQHASWYAKEEYKNWLGITKTRQAYDELCYTAQGNVTEYNAMIAQCVEVVKTAVALPANANLHYLPFLKNDATSVCVCDACTALANQYGGKKSATVVKFMNDLMAAIEADSSITRTDFDLVFFAYEGFETAPTGMTLDDRVTVWLAAPYSFNYQASIDDPTNGDGKENLKAWSDMSRSGDLWLWTYSTKFSDFLFPVDTFAFYNETTYNYFKECGVTVLYDQGQVKQTGTMTAWHNLKLYLGGQLMQDSTKTQSELIARYMEQTFGPAATQMTNFFNSVRTATQADSLKTLYANNRQGAYTLLGNGIILRNNSSCWNKSDIQSWLNYCTQAYAAIDAAKTAGTLSETDYARIKASIDAEWVSPAYMYLCFYGEGDGVTKANLITKVNALGITMFSEFNTESGALVSSSDPVVTLETHINGL